MYIFIFFVAVVIAILSFGSIWQYKSAKWFLIFILTLFAGTRTAGIDNDYAEYSRIFLLYKDFSISMLAEKELSFFIIPFIGGFFFTSTSLVNFSFFLFAFLAICFKLNSFSKEHFFLSLSLYCSYWFFTQEMTTIRAGVASGLFMLAIYDLYYNRNKAYFIKMLLAICFHNSSILFLITWLQIKVVLKLKYYYLMLIGAFLIVIFKINILTLLYLNAIFPKVQIYLDLLDKIDEGPVNIFNFRILFSIAILMLFLLKFNLVKEKKYFLILYKIHLQSLIVFFVLSPTAMVFSLRAFDLLSVVQILLYPYIIYLFKERIMGYFVLFIICIVNFYYVFEISGWFNSYSSWLF